MKMRIGAYVIEVIDGDTFESGSGRMRLAGLDAPEIKSKKGPTSKRKLEELILRKNIEYQEEARDVYGRLVVQAWVDGFSVNNAMIRFVKSL